MILCLGSLGLRTILFRKSKNSIFYKNKYFDLLAPSLYLAFRSLEDAKNYE